MSDEWKKHWELYQEALIEQREFMEQVVQETHERMDRMCVDLIRIGEETRRIGEETRQVGQESRRGLAEANERYNQLFGRMRLSENRLAGMLAATDHDRRELRAICADLDRRLTDVERRL